MWITRTEFDKEIAELYDRINAKKSKTFHCPKCHSTWNGEHNHCPWCENDETIHRTYRGDNEYTWDFSVGDVVILKPHILPRVPNKSRYMTIAGIHASLLECTCLWFDEAGTALRDTFHFKDLIKILPKN